MQQLRHFAYCMNQMHIFLHFWDYIFIVEYMFLHFFLFSCFVKSWLQCSPWWVFWLQIFLILKIQPAIFSQINILNTICRIIWHPFPDVSLTTSQSITHINLSMQVLSYLVPSISLHEREGIIQNVKLFNVSQLFHLLQKYGEASTQTADLNPCFKILSSLKPV